MRIDLPTVFARDVLIPRLPNLLAAYPHLELLVSTTDRRVEIVREGFDCVLRVGPLDDSDLTVRPLGVLPMVNLASASYLRKRGITPAAKGIGREIVRQLGHKGYSVWLGCRDPVRLPAYATRGSMRTFRRST